MMDLSNYRNRVQVTMREYDEFIEWYMKKCNIRVLKIKDRVNVRTVMDKKTKEPVCQVIVKGYDVGYLIWYNLYNEWKASF